MKPRKSVLNLTAEEARRFFLKPSNYFTVPLPPYFDFSGVLSEMMAKPRIEDEVLLKASEAKGVNYTLSCSKDGGYGQRLFQLIHPALYVELVRLVTEPRNWEQIKERLNLRAQQDRIICASLVDDEADTVATTVLRWWRGMEQASIKMSLYFSYMATTDVMECYNMVPLEVFGLALGGPNYREDKMGLGREVEKVLKAICGERSVGVPQGNALVDFLMEVVFAYLDIMFYNAAKREHVKGEYLVLRYRDDYRIFAEDERAARVLVKCLAEVLAQFRMKLNPGKTEYFDDLVMAARKPDKLYWEGRRNSLVMCGGEAVEVSIQKELFAIAELARKYPNSGSVEGALVKLYRDRIFKLEHRPKDAYPLLALTVDIMARNPRVYHVGVAIMTKIMSFNPGISRNSLAERVLMRAKTMPNVDYLEVCLQRLTVKKRASKKYKNRLSALVYEDGAKIWNSEWLGYKIDDRSVVRKDVVREMPFVVPVEEVEIFAAYDEDEFREFRV